MVFCQFKLISSLEKVFFDFPERASAQSEGSMLKNERHSFQLAYLLGTQDGKQSRCRVEILSDLKSYLSVFSVGYVPSDRPVNPDAMDGDYITAEAGLFPDPLYPVRDGQFTADHGKAGSLWFSVETDGTLTGTFPIEIRISDGQGEILTACRYTLTILNRELPPQKLLNTGWFHGDCLAALHHTDVGSEAYAEILEKYLDVYARFGHNMILTPLFTPALDTEVGSERPTNQLVDVRLENGCWQFGFSRLERWIDLCQRHGITRFEMAHLFTQWGAGHAPKIMATADGTYKRVFGWETDALSCEYTEFLNAFLPELREFLEQKGVYNRCFFHVSDEPTEEQAQAYAAARRIVSAHIDESRMIDAISDYVFYETGLIQRPVVSNDHIAPFLSHGVSPLWAYYCCAQSVDVSNRFMAMPSCRSRILGCQLYKYRIEGFLHWGFNFWFTQLSKAVIDPYKVTDAGGAFPSGDAFAVYPLDDAGEVVASLRLYVFAEALQDLRALELLESLTDRKTVEALLEDIEEFNQFPRSPSYLLNLRQTVNARIAEFCDAP